MRHLPVQQLREWIQRSYNLTNIQATHVVIALLPALAMRVMNHHPRADDAIHVLYILANQDGHSEIAFEDLIDREILEAIIADMKDV